MFWTHEKFQEKRRFRVHDRSTLIDQLNELEFVEGQIFANVWHSDRIARISPQTGEVVGWIDLTGLLSPVYRLEPEAVLNGIALTIQPKSVCSLQGSSGQASSRSGSLQNFPGDSFVLDR